MSAATDFSEYGRLQDFIAFAKTGVKIKASANPSRQIVTNKVHPGSHEEMKSEVDMILYTTVFTFRIADEDRKVAKVYMVSSTEESADQIRIDTNIANQRLKVDYERLKGRSGSILTKSCSELLWIKAKRSAGGAVGLIRLV